MRRPVTLVSCHLLTALLPAQLVSNVQHEQEQAANGIGANGKPVLTKVEDFGIKLAHQFPWTPAAAVAVGLALRRRFLSSPDCPSGVVRRLQVTKVRNSCSACTIACCSMPPRGLTFSKLRNHLLHLQ